MKELELLNLKLDLFRLKAHLQFAKGNWGHKGRPGSVGGSGGGGSEITPGDVQKKLDAEAIELRKEGSKIYTANMKSPNMGERAYIDISNEDSKIERKQADIIQKKLDDTASEIKRSDSKIDTYVSREKSPNIGTRVFIDIRYRE